MIVYVLLSNTNFYLKGAQSPSSPNISPMLQRLFSHLFKVVVWYIELTVISPLSNHS